MNRTARIALREVLPEAPPIGKPGDPGLVQPGGVYQRLWGDRRVLLGSAAGLLLQIAHPLIGEGVVAHSEYRSRPGHRTRETLQSPLIAAFGDRQQALDHAEDIGRRHTPVHGKLPTTTGRFKAGERYSARNTTLGLWVWATLMRDVLEVNARYGVPLNSDERDSFYADAKSYARLFGIPEGKIPLQWGDFCAYWDQTMQELAVSPAVFEVSRDILYPRTSPPVPGLGKLVRAVTADLLPEELRVAYELPSTRLRRVPVRALAIALPRAWPHAPTVLRQFPHVESFQQRMRGVTQRDVPAVRIDLASTAEKVVKEGSPAAQ